MKLAKETKSFQISPNKTKIEPKSKAKNVVKAKTFQKIWINDFIRQFKQLFGVGIFSMLKNVFMDIIATIIAFIAIITENNILKNSFTYFSINS